jgi:lysophospholipase L1-like esterase
MSFKVIACLGDSIANGYWDDRGLGWFGRLSEKIALAQPGKFGFNNMAMSGDRVTDVWHRLCHEAISRQPDYMVIAVGVNDTIRWQSPDGPMDISMGLRREMWANILENAKKHFEKIIVCGMTPVLENKFPQEGAYDQPLYHKNSDIDEYNEILESWCREFGVAFVPMKDAWSGLDPEQLIADAGHPNGKGHELMAAFMYDRLIELQIIK